MKSRKYVKENEIVEIDIANKSQDIIAYIPILLCNIFIKFLLTAKIKLPDEIDKILEIKNSLYINECVYLKESIFLRGYNRKYVYFSKMNKLNYFKLDIPFKLFKNIDIDVDFKNSNSYSKDTEDGNYYDETIFFNKPILFDIISNKTVENIKIIKNEKHTTLDSKMVINIQMEMLKKDNIIIPKVKDIDKKIEEKDILKTDCKIENENKKRNDTNGNEVNQEIDKIENDDLKLKDNNKIINENRKDNSEFLNHIRYKIYDYKMKLENNLDIYYYEDIENEDLFKFNLMDQSMKKAKKENRVNDNTDIKKLNEKCLLNKKDIKYKKNNKAKNKIKLIINSVWPN